MDLTCLGKLQSEDSKDPANKTRWILLEVSHEMRQEGEEQLQLFPSHRLDDEFTVVAEEEKATTPASSFTRHEKVLYIVFWR